MPENAPDVIIEPGWNNGIVELLDPPERGWRLLDKAVVLIPNPETTTGGWSHV